MIIEESGPGRNVLLGFFQDDDGDEYLMVTNLWHEKDHSAAATAGTIQLKFDPEVTSVARLSRETGVPEQLVVRDGKLRLRLPGGTGELLRLHDASFPGSGN